MENSDKRIRVGILFGGKSAEHEVSLLSAQNVLAALDRDKFEPVLIGIDKQGTWHRVEQAELLKANQASGLARLNTSGANMTLVPGNTERTIVSASEDGQNLPVDICFPVIHGPLAEDGTIQGFLELAGVPYVGSGVLGSAIGMDKEVQKRLLRDAGVHIADYKVVHDYEFADYDGSAVTEAFGLPLFVKPANMGSSIGVSKVNTAEELKPALEQAFRFDTKVLIEKAIVGDEVECAVLGNDNPKASLPGRIVPEADFYSFDAKYIDEDGAKLEIPAELPESVVRSVQETAVKVFRVLEGSGMSRVDMFVTHDGEIVMNEVNTIPGFTKISMYPQLWEASGLSYTDLITELLHLAIERHDKRQKLQTSYTDELSEN